MRARAAVGLAVALRAASRRHPRHRPRALVKIVLLAALALVVALGTPAGAAVPPTKAPEVLTVGLSMPTAGFQVGAVRGRDVVLARGLEIDLARLLAKRL